MSRALSGPLPLLALLVALPVRAEDARTACQRFPVEVASIRSGAEGGDAYCQAVLGALYWRGSGLPADEREALRWSRRAWQTAEPLALYDKGRFLDGKHGIPLDVKAQKEAYAQARRGFEAAGTGRDPHYDFSLGIIVGRGYDGSAPDPPQGCKYFAKAAEAGHELAQVFYGDCWAEGSLGSVDRLRAKQWYERAAAAGSADGEWALGQLHRADGNLPVAELHFARSAALGTAEDKLRWGVLLEDGVLGKARPAEALALYVSAAAGGSARAAYRAGWLCFTGAEGIKRQLPRARQLFQAAAKAGDADAVNMLRALDSRRAPSH
jgi:TPR repeat protein